MDLQYLIELEDFELYVARYIANIAIEEKAKRVHVSVDGDITQVMVYIRKSRYLFFLSTARQIEEIEKILWENQYQSLINTCWSKGLDVDFTRISKSETYSFQNDDHAGVYYINGKKEVLNKIVKSLQERNDFVVSPHNPDAEKIMVYNLGFSNDLDKLLSHLGFEKTARVHCVPEDFYGYDKIPYADIARRKVC